MSDSLCELSLGSAILESASVSIRLSVTSLPPGVRSINVLSNVRVVRKDQRTANKLRQHGNCLERLEDLRHVHVTCA